MRTMPMTCALVVALLAPPAATAAFEGDYDVANWTVGQTGDPPGGGAPSGVDTSGAPAAVTLTGGDFGCNTFPATSCLTTFTITVQDFEVKFHWEYLTNDLFGPASDPFGYLVNGSLFQLTSDFGASAQAGDEVVLLNPGDTFGFYVDCGFCDLGTASATISEFHVPEPGSLALLGIALAGAGLARRRRAA